MMTNTNSWERLFNGSVEVPEAGYKEIATAKVVYSCGSVGFLHCFRERGSWRVRTSDYTDSFKSKAKLVAQWPQFAGI